MVSTQNGDFKVHAGIQNNVILDFFIFHVFEFYVLDHVSRDARKPVFGVSNQVRNKPACTVTEAG